MSDLIERGEQPDENSTWLGYTRAYYDSIIRNGLGDFIRWDLMPQDSWETIKAVIEGNVAPDDRKWYAIHMLNELWNELQRNDGAYKGSKLTERIPDKNHPLPGTTLFQWYEKYGLFRRAWTPVRKPENLRNVSAKRQPAAPEFADTLQHNVAIASMALGGAERIVNETISALGRAGIRTGLYLLHDAEECYATTDIPRTRVVSTADLPRQEKLNVIAAETAVSCTPSLFVHLMRATDVEALAKLGTEVIPVIHNAEPGWLDPPGALNETSAPVIVAVSEAVKKQLVEFGCTKPVVVLRHEIQRTPMTAEEAAHQRKLLRRRHGIADGTLLIGMVGAFKAQKRYTCAVRVLAALQEFVPARLMVLGDWNHDWGSGRASFAAVCRQAVDLGVMPDLLLPGAVYPVDAYYAAFDVLLCTSLYEGLSISVLEAIACGCPVVTAPSGGNGEVITPRDRVVSERSDVEDYVDAILEVVAQNARVIPSRPHDADLVPHIWALLGAHGIPKSRKTESRRILIVTETLNTGGPQRSLTNLLLQWRNDAKVVVGVLDGHVSGPYATELDDAGMPVVALSCGALVRQARKVLELLDQLGADTLVFWDMPAALKLTCTKVLEVRSDVRIVDVGPGPALLEELSALASTSKRISFSPAQYFARLDRLIAQNNSDAPPGIGSSKVRVIPNGVRLPQGLASLSGLTVGTVGRIVPSKRLEYLIDMMDLLTQRLPDTTLQIAGGSDAQHERYAQYVSDKFVAAGLPNIEFAGPLDDVQPFLDSLSVFVMISENHGSPNASLEAMAAGIPVVANPSNGIVEQIDDGINGFLIDEASPQSMATAVERLLRDYDLRRKMGAAARLKVAEKFSMEGMVEGYRAAFGCAVSAAEMPGLAGFPRDSDFAAILRRDLV